MRRFISIFFVLLLVIIQIPSVGIGEEDTRDYKPNFSIENKAIPSGDAGKVMTLSFNLKNTGYMAKDLVITPIFEGDSPFTVSELTNSQTIKQVNSNSTENIRFKLAISADAIEGNYPIGIDMQYKNAHDDNFTFKETIYVHITSKSSPPRLIINKASTKPEEIGPGGSGKLNLIFENKGTIDAKDLMITLEGLNSDGGFYMNSGSNVAYINRAPGKMVTAANFDVKAANNIRLGSHKLTVNFSYKDIQNNPVEGSQDIYLNVAGKSSNSSNLIIEDLTYPSSGVRPNEDFKLSFNLLNSGEMEASNILVKLDSSDPSLVPKVSNIEKIGSIKPGEFHKLSFIFTATDDSETKSYPISISIEYEDELNQGSENKHLLNQYLAAFVEKPSDASKTTPKLIIDKYSFQPSLVRAGENFDMNLSFYNTNGQKAVRNIKIFLTADEKTDPTGNSGGGNVFTPVGSSNTFFIDTIPAKGRIEKNITMSTVPDAQAKTYTITANFEYEDNEGEEFTATELIGVPVIQQAKLDIGEINYQADAFAGEPIPVFVEFYNTGKVTLYNMMVKLEGDFQTENGSYFVGNFESGRAEYFEGMVIPMEPGELRGDLVFTYEDSSGEDIEVREEFTINIMEQMPMEEFPEDMPPMDQPGGVGNKGTWIVLILIALAAGAFVFYRKRKAKKEEKGMALDE